MTENCSHEVVHADSQRCADCGMNVCDFSAEPGTGAQRAAKAIVDHAYLGEPYIRTIAALIEKHTCVKELAEACEWLISEIDPQATEIYSRYITSIQAVLVKAGRIGKD